MVDDERSLHRGEMVDAKNCNVAAEPHIKQKRFQRRSAEAIAGIESCRCTNQNQITMKRVLYLLKNVAKKCLNSKSMLPTGMSPIW